MRSYVASTSSSVAFCKLLTSTRAASVPYPGCSVLMPAATSAASSSRRTVLMPSCTAEHTLAATRVTSTSSSAGARSRRCARRWVILSKRTGSSLPSRLVTCIARCMRCTGRARR